MAACDGVGLDSESGFAGGHGSMRRVTSSNVGKAPCSRVSTGTPADTGASCSRLRDNNVTSRRRIHSDRAWVGLSTIRSQDKQQSPRVPRYLPQVEHMQFVLLGLREWTDARPST